MPTKNHKQQNTANQMKVIKDKETFHKRLIFILFALLLLSVVAYILRSGPNIDNELELERRLTESLIKEKKLKEDLALAKEKVKQMEGEKKRILMELEKEQQQVEIINSTYNEKRNNVINLPLDESIRFFANWTSGKDTL